MTSINRDHHRVKTGNSLEVYRNGNLLAAATWRYDTAKDKRRIVVLASTDNPGDIVTADKVIERDLCGRIVDNFKTLKSLQRSEAFGRPLVSWAQAFGWLTHV